jgi:hypothetical protein
VPDAFRLALAPDEPSLAAVYLPNYAEATFGGGFGATIVAVFRTGAHEDGQPKGTSFHISNGRVVWIQNDCTNFDELLTPDRIASFVIEPTP